MLIKFLLICNKDLGLGVFFYKFTLLKGKCTLIYWNLNKRQIRFK